MEMKSKSESETRKIATFENHLHPKTKYALVESRRKPL